MNCPNVQEPLAQDQFLTLLSREEAALRFQRHLAMEPLGEETVRLGTSLGRVLAHTLRSPIDVPPFDRSIVDGFAVRAADIPHARHGGARPIARGAAKAMVFQRPIMLRRTTAANVAFALAVVGMSRDKQSTRVADLLHRVGLKGLAVRQARRLSGGEPTTSSARARDPEILFLDDPSASLDPAATKAVEDIRSIVASGIKIVMTTHDLGQASRLAGEIAFLVRGRIVEHAPAERFLTSPATPSAVSINPYPSPATNFATWPWFSASCG